MLTEVWQRAAALLETQCAAEEEVCFPVLFADPRSAAMIADAAADHTDIRAAAAEARLQEVGSHGWWQAVAAVIDISREHFRREEDGLLAAVQRRAHPAQRDALGRQWAAFSTARARDAENR